MKLDPVEVAKTRADLAANLLAQYVQTIERLTRELEMSRSESNTLRAMVADGHAREIEQARAIKEQRTEIKALEAEDRELEKTGVSDGWRLQEQVEKLTAMNNKQAMVIANQGTRIAKLRAEGKDLRKAVRQSKAIIAETTKAAQRVCALNEQLLEQQGKLIAIAKVPDRA